MERIVEEMPPRRRRANIRLAVVLALVAAGFYAFMLLIGPAGA